MRFESLNILNKMYEKNSHLITEVGAISQKTKDSVGKIYSFSEKISSEAYSQVKSVQEINDSLKLISASILNVSNSTKSQYASTEGLTSNLKILNEENGHLLQMIGDSEKGIFRTRNVVQTGEATLFSMQNSMTSISKSFFKRYESKYSKYQQ